MSDGKRGASRLSRVLVKEISKRSKRLPVSDLAKVKPNMSLALETFGVPIPEGEYLIEESFGARTSEESGGGGYAEFANHDHEVRAELAPGDRVIVLILDADSDAPTFIVTGRIS